jgi:branched-chain amino acid transport system substrate-binding protein
LLKTTLKEIMLKKLLLIAVLLSTLTMTAVHAQTEEPVKIGFIGTLSGALSTPGTDIFDGFNLALEHLGSTAGGRPIELIVRDDTLNTELATTQAAELLEEEQVDFITGLVYTNILLTIAPQVFEAETFLISASAGPSQLAGEGCSPYFFNVSYQNDTMNEAMGQYISQQGFENVYALAPDYAAGRDAINGFKRYFTGKLSGEIYTPLDRTDFSAELELIREAAPDAVYTFLVPASAIGFINQYSEAGLMGEIPLFLPGVSADVDTISATGTSSEGLYNAAAWAINLDNEANARFVADFMATYDRVPSIFAAQGYDSAMLIVAAVEAVGGDLSDKAAVQAALETVEFDSVRGDFTFGNNHYPVQNIYLRQVTMNDKGELVNMSVDTIFENHSDAYHQDCALGSE